VIPHPATIENGHVAELLWPPRIAELVPIAQFKAPPTTDEKVPCALLQHPPRIEDDCVVTLLQTPPITVLYTALTVEFLALKIPLKLELELLKPPTITEAFPLLVFKQPPMFAP
jgi:hypothetical protein